MANWQLPTTASTYVNYTAELDARLDDLAYGLDPAYTTATNVPTNTMRFNSVSAKWEKFNGTAWADAAVTYAINAATASAWQTGRTIALTGDVTATSAAWTGSGNLSITTTLPNVNSNVGAFGSSSAIPVITVNAKGQITAVSTVALGGLASQSASSVAITGGAISGTTLTLKQSTTAAPTAEGVMEWDTDDDVLKIGTGAATKTLVNTDNTQTLTNKTLGSGSTWNGNALGLAYGGTGATDAAAARTNLGIASMGTQAASAVAITGGTIAGTAITLVQSTTAAPTAEGRLEWDTDGDLLVLGTGSGTKIQVNTDSVQTLTNKTMGAGSTWLGNLAIGTTASAWNSSTTVIQMPGGGSILGLANGLFLSANWYYDAGGLNKRIANGGASQLVMGEGGSYFWQGSVTGLANSEITWITLMSLNSAGDLQTTGSIRQGSNQVLHAGNYNAYTPSLSGSGAFGTWSITATSALACTGNAATVTNGVYTTGDQTIAGTKFFSAPTVGLVTSGTGGYGHLVRNTSTANNTTKTASYGFQGTDTIGNVKDVGAIYLQPVEGDWTNGLMSFWVRAGNAMASRASLSYTGDFTANGNVTAYSDESLKHEWAPLAVNFIEALAQVKHGTYSRIDTGMRQVGVSAQSLQPVMPEAIVKTHDGKLAVAYGNAAMAACIELAREIVALKAEMVALKGAA